MMRVLSPHLDDAVLSLGEMLSTSPCEVVTVFAGTPTTAKLSPYDASCGFTSSAEAMAMRRSEDAAATGRLRCRFKHLDFLDGQYVRRRDAGHVDAVTDAIAALFDPTEHLIAPLGIGHPDHRFVAMCACRACPADRSLLLYEELPYRVLNPEEVRAALDEVRDRGFVVDELVWPFPFTHDASSAQAKREAIACYRSQFPNGAEDPCLMVPERVWRATR